jgi:Tfp pilus assembly protein PilF
MTTVKTLPWVLAAAMMVAPASRALTTAPEWVARGRILLDSGKNDAAAKAFESALKLDEKNSETHMLLAQALGNVARKANVFKQGMMARRIKGEMERARELDPKSIDPHEGLIDYYLEAPGIMGGSVAKAKLEAVEIAKLNPLRGHLAHAKIARNEKDSVTMEREYRSAAAAYPDSLSAVVPYASYLYEVKKPGDAFAVFDRFAAQHPEHPMGFFYIGRMAALTGLDLDRGEAAIRRYLALQLNPADRALATPAVARLRLGEILVKKGDKPGGRREFETALQLNPNLEAAKTALKNAK